MGKHSHHKKTSKHSNFFDKWGGIDNEPKFIELPDDFGDTSSEEGHNGDAEDLKKNKHHYKEERSKNKEDSKHGKGKGGPEKDDSKHTPLKNDEKESKKHHSPHHSQHTEHEHGKHGKPEKSTLHQHEKKEHEESRKGHETHKKEQEGPKKMTGHHEKEQDNLKKGHESCAKDQEGLKRGQEHHEREFEELKQGNKHHSQRKDNDDQHKKQEHHHHKNEHEGIKKEHGNGKEDLVMEHETSKKGEHDHDKKETHTHHQSNPGDNKTHFQEPAQSPPNSAVKQGSTQSSGNIQGEGQIPTKNGTQDNLPKPQGDCEVCGHLAKLFCSACKHVFYCTKEHQKKHWRNHKEDCPSLKKLPYRVERNDKLGRHLVATMDIPAGTHFLNESPMVLGPRQLSKPVCLGCHKELTDPQATVKCSRCQWPLCSRKCEDSKSHEAECRLIKYGGSKVKVDSFGQVNMMYACITVLRALALQDGPQEVWKDYTRFESHLDKRMKTEIYTKVNKEKVVYFIHYFLKLINKFSDLEILETCGRLDTNCFEIKQNGLNLRAMYRTACIISHDCKPNTKHTFDPDHSINMYSTINIAKGSIISASYTQTIWSTLNRREHLYMSKCFWCMCERCQDPTEFGTYLSCYNCLTCGGRVLPENPLDNEASWSCETCCEAMTATDVKEIYTRVTSELKEVDRSDPDCLERFMLEQAPILPDSNQLIREIQFGLVCLLKVANPEWLTHHHLLRKAFLSKDLLNVANQLEPGLSKWRGQLLFEMQSSNVVLAQRALNENKITSFQAKEIFEENLKHLTEAVSILQVEPEEKEKLHDELKALSKAMDEVESAV